MSDFSDVDASPDVEGLVSYLNATDVSAAAMKAYVVAAARRAVPGGVVLDLGCGVGHDLARLLAAGLHPLGVDSSSEMLAGARTRVGPRVPLTRADAAHLPFRDASLDGCRIERVLQHVEAPDAVVAEVARVLRPGGFLAVFEPDFTTFRVESDEFEHGEIPARLLRARHPSIGRHTVALVEAHGFEIDDVVTESSRGYHLDRLPVPAEGVVQRAVRDGRLDARLGTRWISEQRRRSATGRFRASWDKVLVVARRP